MGTFVDRRRVSRRRITVSAELGYTPAFYRKNSEFADIFEEIREKYGVK